MLINKAAKLINILPKPIVVKIAKYIVKKLMAKYAKITVINKERLDKIKDPVIFISNHLSNSDGLILNEVLKEKDIWFVAGVKLSKNPYTNLGLEVVKSIPINPNSADKTAISNIIKLLKDGHSVCIFPEGTRSRTGALIPAKKGILLIARLAKVPIVPIGIQGSEKLLPINDDDMGMERFNHAQVKVTIGEEFYIPLRENGEDKESYENRALYTVMRKIAELLPLEYQGVYKEN